MAIFDFILTEFIFGTLRSTVVGGGGNVSSQQSSQKSSNGLKPCSSRAHRIGGRGEIRTHGGREPTAVFKTAALNRSATRPYKLNCDNSQKRAGWG